MKWEQFSQYLDHFIGAKFSSPVILILDGHVFAYSNTREVINKLHFLVVFATTLRSQVSALVEFFGSLKVYYSVILSLGNPNIPQ
jgi:hypothetical protein